MSYYSYMPYIFILIFTHYSVIVFTCLYTITRHNNNLCRLYKSI